MKKLLAAACLAALLPTLAQAGVSGGAPNSGPNEGHIGEVHQNFAEIAVAPTITASSAYGSGAVVGGLLTFSNTGRNATSPFGRIEEVTIYSKSAQSGELDFVWCGANNPTGSTITDKTALSIAAADFNKCRVVAQLTNWQSFGTPSVVSSGQIATPFVLASGTTGYGFLVARSTPTFASTSDIQVTLRLGR